MYNKTKNFTAREKEIKLEHISLVKPIHLYVSMVVIDESHRNNKNAFALMRKYKSQMKVLIENGMEIAEIVTDQCTNEGSKIVKMFGMKKFIDIKYGTMYILDGKIFMRAMIGGYYTKSIGAPCGNTDALQ